MFGSYPRKFFAALCLMLFMQPGCAAFRPMNGVPARYIPEDMKVGNRSGRKTINLDMLTQPKQAHLIDTGDVLGIYIEGIVGKSTDPPPVHFPQNQEAPPSFGLPFPVRDDGTISLPIVGSISLRGLTVVQAEHKVTQAYLKPRQILKDDNLRVQVNLQRPRQYRVLVIRQDSRNEPLPNAMIGQMTVGTAKRGTGKVVHLPAYSNDVLNALTLSDGLPGLDAENAVYVIRRRDKSTNGPEANFPLDFDPAQLIRKAKSVRNPVIRGQSPDQSYMSGTESSRYGSSARQSSIRSSAQSTIYASQGMTANGVPPYGSIRPDESIQPPRIWPDRTINPNDGTMMMESDTVEYTGTGYPQQSGYGRQTSDVQTIRDAGYGSMPSQSRANVSPYSSYRINPNDNSGRGSVSQADYSSQRPSGRVGFATGTQMQGSPAQGYAPQDNMRQGTQRDPSRGNQGYKSANFSAPNSGRRNDPQFTPAANRVPSQWIDDQPMYQGGMPGDMTNGPVIYDSPQLSPTPIGPGHSNIDPVETDDALDGRHVIRIPIRLGPGETADIRPEDVILNDGDIVFIESRDTEVYYTGGLLGGGQFLLPRDYDLNIMQAISLSQSRSIGVINKSIGGISALNNDVSISPSTAIVIRKLPEGGEMAIKVDLYRARVDPAERIIIQSGDFILLQFTPLEAVGAFIERHLLETALFSLATQNLNKTSN